ncbi:RNA processing protein [Beauveria asiatica]|uniref:LSM complex subunit LSM4 n=1 Tax=Beauveria asiatica TaxID=1069075 RepID=A0AAW0RLV3_9HYPO
MVRTCCRGKASATPSPRASHRSPLNSSYNDQDFANPPVALQLPLGLLNAAQGHPMLVELKNGETLNGHLVNCDTWMNLTLKEVVQTSPEGDKFVRLPEVYVKGNNIKYLRVPEEIIELATEAQKNQQGNFRGGRGGQSRGDHGGRGGGGDRGRGGRGGGRGGRGRGGRGQ